MNTAWKNLEQDGFTLVPGVLNAVEVERLRVALGPVNGAGRRGLLGLSAVVELTRSARLLDLVRPHLPADPVPVRALYFDKSPDANWLVPWHQDLTLALRARAESPGFGPWSVKNDIPHVQPPVACLERMLAVRLHLDAADAANGALRVLPGTHRTGRLTPEGIQQQRTERAEHLCAASAGDALLMRPLLLHASNRSDSPRHRRVLHLEFAAFDLPENLHWHEAA